MAVDRLRRRLVFTANDRPYYFGPVMRRWAQVRGFNDWQPTVYLEPSRVQQQMVALATAAGATVSLNPTRRGVLSNPWYALDRAFEGGAEFAVLAEDDVLVSDDILEYFTWAATQFADAQVLAVCACSFAPVCAPGHEQHTVRHKQFCPLVWGTWHDRWAGALRDTWDHHYDTGTPQAPQSGWDWNINLRVIPGGADRGVDWDIVSPIASRSTHIGEHMGTHTTPASFPNSIAPTFTAQRPAAPFHPPSNR